MAANFIDTAWYGAESLISAGATDISVVKYDAEGQLVWLMRDGGIDYDYLQAISPAEDGFFIAGSFYGQTQIGGTGMTSMGSQDLFVARYSTDGSMVWLKQLGSPKTDFLNDSDTDPQGNLFITGHYYDSISLGGTTLYALAGSDVFLAKYDPQGTLLWARNMGGSSSDQSYSLSCDASGNVALSGSFFFDIQIADTMLTTEDPTGIFMAGFDGNGDALFVIQGHGSSLGASSRLEFSDDGGLYFCGTFSETINIGPYTFQAGAFNADIFLSRYDSEGQLLWAAHASGAGSDQLVSISTGPLGELYLSGHYLDTIHFGSLTLDYTLCCGSAEIFIVCYTPDGSPSWGRQVSGVAAIAEGMARNAEDKLFISGMFRDELSFGSMLLNSGTDYRNFLAGIHTETATLAAGPSSREPMAIYPNPARDVISISIPQGKEHSYRIYSLQAIPLAEGRLHTGKNIDISGLPAGKYILVVKDHEKNTMEGIPLIKL